MNLTSNTPLTRQQAEAIYDLGKEAVVQFMLDFDAKLQEATLRIKELERRLNMDSHNSSKPPSSDSPFNSSKSTEPSPSITKIKKLKKRGGQKGHKGKTLKLSAHPDKIEQLIPTSCTQCGKSLKHLPTKDSTWKRQVWDIPEIKLHITEYQSLSKECPCCKKKSYGTFPSHVTSRLQFGSSLIAFCSYLSAVQMMPHERIGELSGDLFGHPLSVGAIDTMLSKTHHALKGVEEEIKEHLQKEELLCADETGIEVGNTLRWLHTLSSKYATLYTAHTKRGKEGMDESAVLPSFKGILMHDHWGAYKQYTNATHAYCNAHILRELTGVIENEKLQWAKDAKVCLRAMHEAVKRAKEDGKESLSQPQINKFIKAWRETTKAALSYYASPPKSSGKRGRAKQSKSKNLLDRLISYESETLRFLKEFRVPFTNNLAERDLRMTKVKLKISGCFMSEFGAKRFARIRGYISTLKKSGESVLAILKEAINGRAYLPAVVRGG